MAIAVNEVKENLEAQQQNELSIRLDSILSKIRDDAQRNGISDPKEIEKLCQDLMNDVQQGRVDIFTWQPDPIVLDPVGVQGNNQQNNQQNANGSGKESKELKDNAERKLQNEGTNKDTLIRCKKEMQQFMENIFDKYKCQISLEYPVENPVRIPKHPSPSIKIKQQIWDRSYISQVDKCPLTRLPLPKAGGFWQPVADPFEPAIDELFLFLVAAHEWMLRLPSELIDSPKDIDLPKPAESKLAELKPLEKAIREAYDEISGILKDKKNEVNIKNAKATLAQLKSGNKVFIHKKVGAEIQQIELVSDSDKKLLSFLIRTTEEDNKIRESEEKREAERLLERNKKMDDFKNIYNTFRCPIGNALPNDPVQIVNHPIDPLRNRFWTRASIANLDKCPISNENWNLAADDALRSANTELCLFAVASNAWFQTLTPQELNTIKDERQDIEKQLNEAGNADALKKARELFVLQKTGQAAINQVVVNVELRGLLDRLIRASGAPQPAPILFGNGQAGAPRAAGAAPAIVPNGVGVAPAGAANGVVAAPAANGNAVVVNAPVVPQPAAPKLTRQVTSIMRRYCR